MDLSSWFRRSLSSKNTKNPNPQKQSHQQEEEQKQQEEEELLGVTEQLINFVKTFTLDTFKNFPVQDEEGRASSCGGETETPTTSTNVRNDLSEWQERHATLVLSKVKEISQLRYKLCPRNLKEPQFWRIYFKLVKTHVVEYELRAVQLEKLKSMAMENEKSSDTSACEVEMAETKHAGSLVPPTP